MTVFKGSRYKWTELYGSGVLKALNPRLSDKNIKSRESRFFID